MKNSITTTHKYSRTIENIWAKAYSVIANANEALTNMEGQESSLNEVYYHVIKGELLAIRAYMHFDLLRLYGYGDWKTVPQN